jgi:hypothetical protein
MKFFAFIIVFIAINANAQSTDALLVYSVKGNVTAVFKEQETAVKIGRVLMPGTVIKTEKDASLTMVCKKGKPLCVTREGVYPLTIWKDSCRTSNNSLAQNYFSYIWSEFYTRSPEYREQARKNNDFAISRGGPATGKMIYIPNKPDITFSKGLDTINYTGGNFPLSWNCFNYNGKYVFRLYDVKGVQVIYIDSVRENYISIQKFIAKIEPGHSYKWNISAPGSGVLKKRVLNYYTDDRIQPIVDTLLNSTIVAEDSANRFFRIAYLLEKLHWLPQALYWYEKATNADPEIDAFRDKFVKFRDEYWIR